MKELIELHSEVKQYAVYAHYYEGIPFYIGSGIYHRDNISKSRAYDFFNRGPDWFDYCDGETEKIEVELLFQTNDRKLAFDKEEEITKTYIEKGYKLTNKDFGVCRSAETRKLISLAKKGKMSGKNHPMYGKKHTKETRELMSLALRGKMSGKDHPMYGKKRSEETRNKISLAQKGEKGYWYGKRGEDNPMYGKKHTKEARERMSLVKKGRNNTRAKKVLVTNNPTGESKVFDSIKDVYEFVSQNRFDKTQGTLRYHLNKGSYDFKNYTIELTK